MNQRDTRRTIYENRGRRRRHRAAIRLRNPNPNPNLTTRDIVDDNLLSQFTFGVGMRTPCDSIFLKNPFLLASHKLKAYHITEIGVQ